MENEGMKLIVNLLFWLLGIYLIVTRTNWETAVGVCLVVSSTLLADKGD